MTVRMSNQSSDCCSISAAVGLTCAEDSLYAFYLGGTQDNLEDVMVGLKILLFWSMFPIQALGAGAAMQSISMIGKFIEEKHCGERNIGAGPYHLPCCHFSWNVPRHTDVHQCLHQFIVQ
jgi:hypothetical protein